MQAMKALTRPGMGPIIIYLRTGGLSSRKDTSAVFRWLSSMRLADTEIQLKCAGKVIEWAAKHYNFLVL